MDNPQAQSRAPREWSISALVDNIGVSRPTLLKRLDGVPYRWEPKQNAKLYLLPDVIRAMAEGAPGKLDFDQAKARKMTADAGVAEIELMKQRGQVVELSAIETVLTNEYSALRAKLLNLPAKLAPLMDATKGIEPKRALLTREITEALEELDSDEGIRSILSLAAEARAAAAVGDDDQEGEEGGISASAVDDGEPVGGRKAKAKRGK